MGLCSGSVCEVGHLPSAVEIRFNDACHRHRKLVDLFATRSTGFDTVTLTPLGVGVGVKVKVKGGPPKGVSGSCNYMQQTHTQSHKFTWPSA